VLLNDSVYFNIHYAKLSSTQADIEQAAQAAQIHSRILEFPDQYRTVVGERGLRLSGGEKQRVAIARALLKDPDIFLLDEATSALDTETERAFQQVFHEERKKHRTVVVVAHRLSTIVHADMIVVINNGCKAEEGTHDELLRQGGLYYEMWQRQLTGKEVV
jgi:ABC-type transport system involved in Fe-S cluster assembly fused permease/ATPase subunit